MSRIGRQPIALEKGVEVKIADGHVTVKGPKATLSQALIKNTSVRVDGDRVLVERSSDDQVARAAHGLMRKLVANMVHGASKGFERALEIQGVGYRAEVKGRQLTILVGYSHPVLVEVPQGLEVKGESPTRLVVSGADRQQVGQFAANLRQIRPPEPYKGKGIRYADEIVRRKVGKSAGA